jgi:hypothetical protein
MNSNYNIELVQKRLNKKTGEERKQLSITKKNKKLITLKEVETIYNRYVAKGIQPSRICIVGENAERLLTIKEFKKDELFDGNGYDYMEGKSQEVIDKLSKFRNVQVIIY